MARTEVVNFLQALVRQPELQTKLKTFPKPEVLAYAEQAGYKFTEQEFDDTVWGIEIFLANKLGENFDLTFSLWETMWGKYYLEYLAVNVIDSLSQQEIDEFLNQ
ncbi:Nif11 family protein [Chroococcidiopsis sp. FACHB-1243]|uniref:Nif11-like leader peptide family natural product precursor n=1 Tax=Chroococcidiopsis sp. [FACHB-1243] TaxID=2692781 RepID=UPI00177CE697|nr:Nif11-like leader peptide family natural product precursor [Chroococcidiopsis sp. [FACHB-1243]]MBD2305274.1 Nif11 family protein [Chroococcidiopsis sp. [FACHB-1243]]